MPIYILVHFVEMRSNEKVFYFYDFSLTNANFIWKQLNLLYHLFKNI